MIMFKMHLLYALRENSDEVIRYIYKYESEQDELYHEETMYWSFESMVENKVSNKMRMLLKGSNWFPVISMRIQGSSTMSLSAAVTMETNSFTYIKTMFIWPRV